MHRVLCMIGYWEISTDFICKSDCQGSFHKKKFCERGNRFIEERQQICSPLRMRFLWNTDTIILHFGSSTYCTLQIFDKQLKLMHLRKRPKLKVFGAEPGQGLPKYPAQKESSQLTPGHEQDTWGGARPNRIASQGNPQTILFALE